MIGDLLVPSDFRLPAAHRSIADQQLDVFQLAADRFFLLRQWQERRTPLADVRDRAGLLGEFAQAVAVGEPRLELAALIQLASGSPSAVATATSSIAVEYWLFASLRAASYCCLTVASKRWP